MRDDELINRIRQGDRAAGEELIRRWYQPVLRYCRWCCKDKTAAEDMAQETFFRLFRSLPAYREGGGNLRVYLFSIARRLCIDENRRGVPSPLGDGEQLVKEYDEICQAEDRAQIDALLGVLSPEQRTAVVLRYGEGLSFREIADVMGSNLRTAQSRVRCAIQIMRKVFNGDR